MKLYSTVAKQSATVLSSPRVIFRNILWSLYGKYKNQFYRGRFYRVMLTTSTRCEVAMPRTVKLETLLSYLSEKSSDAPQSMMTIGK